MEPISVKDFILKGYHGVMNQGCRSTTKQFTDSEDEICLYRGPNNTRCFVGHSMPDELYSQAHKPENRGFESIKYTSTFKNFYSNIRGDFGLALQGAHDGRKIFITNYTEIPFDNKLDDKEFANTFKDRVVQVLKQFKIDGYGPEILEEPYE